MKPLLRAFAGYMGVLAWWAVGAYVLLHLGGAL